MNTDQLHADVVLRFSILPDKSRFEWHNQLRYVRDQTFYDPSVTQQYFEALTLLRQFLGESFLKHMGYTHPLATMILDAGPWQIQRLYEYAKLLSYLSEKDTDYRPFLRMLLSTEKAKKEGMHFLHTVQLLRSTGLDIHFPDATNDIKKSRSGNK